MWERAASRRRPASRPITSADLLAQRSNGVGRSEAHGKLVVVSTTDHRSVVGIFSDPDNSIGVDKDLHAVDIFKHYKLHVASFYCGRSRFQACQITKPCRSIVLNARKTTASNDRRVATELLVYDTAGALTELKAPFIRTT